MGYADYSVNLGLLDKNDCYLNALSRFYQNKNQGGSSFFFLSIKFNVPELLSKVDFDAV